MFVGVSHAAGQEASCCCLQKLALQVHEQPRRHSAWSTLQGQLGNKGHLREGQMATITACSRRIHDMLLYISPDMPQPGNLQKA